MTSPTPSEDASKKPRAKHACRTCNTRRVRCDVMETKPCSNCVASGSACEVLPSRRGRYPRKKRRKLPAREEVHSSESPASQLSKDALQHIPTSEAKPQANTPMVSASSPSDAYGHGYRTRRQAAADASTPSSTGAAGTRFYGESNFLNMMPSEQSGSPADKANAQKPRLTFQLPNTPQSQGHNEGPNISAGTMRYLQDEGALTFPDADSCLPALKAYFTWFHPCFPVVDRADVTRRLVDNSMSKLLMHTMLMIGSIYCEESTIQDMGFKDRSEAKAVCYTKARLLFHADWEKDEITLLQSLFLMSFWRGGPTDVRDVRYWLGVVLTLSESFGMHRKAGKTTRMAEMTKMRRRIWWSIYVRERQVAVSLGLPSRIRDEDCDIEPLNAADLESGSHELQDSYFGYCQSDHVVYAIKMVELARLLGRSIDLHFVPGRTGSKSSDIQALDTALEQWRNSLPEHMRHLSEEGGSSVWACLLQLGYNHLRILIHRDSFLTPDDGSEGGQAVTAAACRISRIAEDMYTGGTLRFAQMHLITSLMAALCIHVISIRRGKGVTRRIAEHRAQMCLLCLKEIQKYWRINITVLDLFLQYLDCSIAERLHATNPADERGAVHAAGEDGAEEAPAPAPHAMGMPMLSGTAGTMMNPAMASQPEMTFDDQYFTNLMNGHWEGDDALGDLGLFLQVDDASASKGLNVFGKGL